MTLPADHLDVSRLPADERWMRVALSEAAEAERHGDVPIGAVVVLHPEQDDARIIGRGHNQRERDADPTAHAEILALRQAAAAVGSWRVLDATLYVTLEPCAMCAGAIVLSRIPRVVFGCTDPKAGACGSVLNVTAEPRLNHRPTVVGGVLANDCSGLLRAFFAARRIKPVTLRGDGPTAAEIVIADRGLPGT